MKPGERGEHVPLLGHPSEPEGTSTLYNYGVRLRRDIGWLIAYLVFMGATLACGVALFYTGSPDFIKQITKLDDPSTCPADPPLRRRGLLSHDDGPTTGYMASLLAHPVSAASCTVAGSIALGFLFVLGFRHTAHHMIRLALVLQLMIPLTLAAGALVHGAFIPAGFLGFYCVLLVWVFWLWREQIALVGRLLGVTGSAMVDNPGILGVGLAMPVLWGLLLVPTMIFAGSAMSNGHPTRNSEYASMHKDAQGAMQCVNGQGDAIMCCTWELDPVAKAYMAALGVAFTWTTLLLGQIKLFTVAGAVAQWYFAPPAPLAGLSSPPRRSRVMLSLCHALGPSIGSLCAASALLTVISYMKQALDAAERQTQHENKAVAIIAMIVASILRIVLSLVEFLTRFTTIRMAITGEAFFDAAHGAVNLLKRNALDAFGVWWLPPFILGNCMFAVSVLFGGLVWGASSLVYRAEAHDQSCIILGVAAWATAMVVLSFLKGLLMNTLESVFVCFAMDRDMHRVTRQDVHEVLKEVPGVPTGPVFEQPDGDLAYGAPTGSARV